MTSIKPTSHSERAAWTLSTVTALHGEPVQEPRDMTDYLPGLRLEPTVKRRGPVPVIFTNPFCGHLDVKDRYDPWSEHILTGVARLDHGGTKPLPLKALYELLEAAPELSTATISEHLGIGPRMAQRYLSALHVALQYLMRSRPRWLRLAMGEEVPELAECEPESVGYVCPVQLAKLRADLGADAFQD